MATPSEKLAESLSILKGLQENGIVAINTSRLTRTLRERLLENGFIKEVYQGWYVSAPPNEKQGDSTSWYSSYWNFCAQLMKDKYGQNWCVSPEQSLLLHAGNWSVPQQLIIKSPKEANFKTDLPYGTSLFHLKSKLPEKREIIENNGIRMLSLPAALIQIAPNTFTQNPTDARTALSVIKDASQILNLLLEGGQSIVAGRLAGAFRNIKNSRISNDIISTMEKTG